MGIAFIADLVLYTDSEHHARLMSASFAYMHIVLKTQTSICQLNERLAIFSMWLGTVGDGVCVSAGWQRHPAAQRLSGKTQGCFTSQQRAASEETAGQWATRTSQHQVRIEEILVDCDI